MLSLINAIEQQRQTLRQRTAQIDVVHIGKAVPNSRRRRATKTSPGRVDCFAGHHGSCVSKGQSAATAVCSIGNLVFLSTSPPTAEEQIVVAGFVNSRPAPPPRPPSPRRPAGPGAVTSIRPRPDQPWETLLPHSSLLLSNCTAALLLSIDGMIVTWMSRSG
jgi:hypothetical protein